jgi:bifunctional DNA-binding transcriptional regulator/antitoxin component of YhaV-PrlF toxin-antitoxin module
VIPSEMRSSPGIEPGSRIAITQDGRRIVLEPVSEELVEKTRGMFSGKPSLSGGAHPAAPPKGERVTFALDSSAIQRYLGDEAGAPRVSELIESHVSGRCEVLISALHWGRAAN